MFQTTKSEGLSGIIGGASSSSLGGKSGTDRMLESFTRYMAIGWFICTAITTWFYFRG
jgi:protein translocase SecG subunit